MIYQVSITRWRPEIEIKFICGYTHCTLFFFCSFTGKSCEANILSLLHLPQKKSEIKSLYSKSIYMLNSNPAIFNVISLFTPRTPCRSAAVETDLDIDKKWNSIEFHTEKAILFNFTWVFFLALDFSFFVRPNRITCDHAPQFSHQMSLLLLILKLSNKKKNC